MPRRAISKCHFSLSLPPPDAICCRLNLGHSLVVVELFSWSTSWTSRRRSPSQSLFLLCHTCLTRPTSIFASTSLLATSSDFKYSPISSRIVNCLLSSDLIIHRFYICKECFPGFKVSIAPLQNIVWVFHSNSGSFRLHNFTEPLLFWTTACLS